MATYTRNYGWTKPSGSDNVDISVLNNNLDDQDSTIHDAFLNMAPPFSESSTYAVNDIVLYGTGLYKCHTAVVTPGSWTGSTNWQVYKLSEGGSGGGGTSNYNDLTNKPSINGVTLSGNKTTSDLGINADNVMMSDGVTSVEDAIDEVALKIAKTKIVNVIGVGQSVTIESTDSDFIRMIILKRGSASVVAVALVDYWDTSATTVFGQIPSAVHITKEALSGTITISRDAGGSGPGIAYMVI